MHWQVLRLKEVLGQMAAPAEAQLSLDVSPNDFMANEFDESFGYLRAMVSSAIPESLLPMLLRIDAILEDHAGRINEFWQRQALSSNPDWETVRQRARRALEVPCFLHV